MCGNEKVKWESSWAGSPPNLKNWCWYSLGSYKHCLLAFGGSDNIQASKHFIEGDDKGSSRGNTKMEGKQKGIKHRVSVLQLHDVGGRESIAIKSFRSDFVRIVDLNDRSFGRRK